MLVGQVSLPVNANDVMDQTISLSGVGPFDRAEFRFSGEIDEVIDNLVVETVPEPGTLGLVALAIALRIRRELHETGRR